MLAPILLALTFATEGPSFDCAKATADDEKLVCVESALARLDRELARSFVGKLKSADAATAAEIKQAQRVWLAERASCTRPRGSIPAPSREVARKCLETSYGWRIRELDDLPPRKPELPPGIVAKRIVRRDPRARDVVDVSYPALARGRPGGDAFDAWFAKAAATLVGDRGTFGADTDEDPELPATSLDATFTVPLATPRLVTVVVDGYDHGGGAHGQPFRIATTFDLLRGRPLALEDVFVRGPAIAHVLLPTAMNRLVGVSEDWDDAEEHARKVLGEASSWTFASDAAVVTFPPYSVAPYAAGSPEVRFGWAELVPHLKAEAPLPPR